MALLRYYPSNTRTTRETEWRPDVDVIEQPEDYVVYIDLPGLEKGAFRLHFDEGILTVSGERKRTEPAGVRREEYYRYHERPYGEFTRTFRIPGNVDENSIKAVYQNGVLEIRLKKNEETRPKTIQIS
jgi:HSP20 family protein